MSQPYAVITPVRNEAANLERLAESLREQRAQVGVWLIVDAGSDDDTVERAATLSSSRLDVRVVTHPVPRSPERGPAIVEGFEAGIRALDGSEAVVAKVDADITLPPHYFERLLEELDGDAALGVVSGSCFEQKAGTWRQRYGTGTSVWGAARAYRRECLAQLLPLERRTGWDVIDVAEADVLGWRTRTLLDLPFYHHRAEGARERSRRHAWAAEGRAAHYLGYRPSYLILRTAYRMVRDPAALAMLPAFAKAALRGEPQCERTELVRRLRDDQRLRRLHRRAGEAVGRGGT